MQTVYDADGKEFVVEPVDAREYIASGQWFKDKPEQKNTEAATTKKGKAE